MRKPSIKVLKSHTGLVLVSGAIILKLGAVSGSLILLVGGYGALFYGVTAKIKSWRDKK